MYGTLIHMEDEARGWELVGQAVRERSDELGIDSYEEGARRSGLSRYTWKRLHEGESVKVGTLRTAERTLGLTSGSLTPRRLLAGHKPELLSSSDPGTPSPPPGDERTAMHPAVASLRTWLDWVNSLPPAEQDEVRDEAREMLDGGSARGHDHRAAS